MTNYEKLEKGNLLIPNSAKSLGASLVSYDAQTSSLEKNFSVGSELSNPTGHIQGGFLCAMLDECMGPVIFYSLEEDYIAPTLELKTQFIRAAVPGVFVGTARVISKGKQICFVEGHLYQQNELVASASATAMIKKCRDKLDILM